MVGGRVEGVLGVFGAGSLGGDLVESCCCGFPVGVVIELGGHVDVVLGKLQGQWGEFGRMQGLGKGR